MRHHHSHRRARHRSRHCSHVSSNEDIFAASGGAVSSNHNTHNHVPSWQSVPRAWELMGVQVFDDLLSADRNCVSQDQALLRSTVQGSGAADSSLDGNHRYSLMPPELDGVAASYVGTRGLVWQTSLTAGYHLTPDEQHQISASSTPSSPTIGDSTTFSRGTHSQLDSSSYWGYHSPQAWTHQAPRDWAEVNRGWNRRSQHFSVQVFQGSDDGHFNPGQCDNTAARISTGQAGILEELDSNGSSDGEHMAVRNQYVRNCMNDEDPWSPQRPRQTPRGHHPY
ncbi:hypothetical protein GGS21DRAFT_418104 [Xylaria nigripes]|nr:hypothetical protein GGS21DRAFT_418104 [Xylaria nigripes]